MNATMMTNEQAIEAASTIVALSPLPEGFPGMDALGNPEAAIGEAIINAGFSRSWAVDGDYQNTRAFGELVAMIQYGIADIDKIKAALRHAKATTCTKTPNH